MMIRKRAFKQSISVTKTRVNQTERGGRALTPRLQSRRARFSRLLRSLPLALALLISLVIERPLIASGRGAVSTSSVTHAQLSPRDVERWLTHHTGRKQFKMSSKGGMSDLSWISVERGPEGVIHVWFGSHSRVDRGRPLDHYHVTHKRFQKTAPYRLLGADLYRLDDGEAIACSWRRDRSGQGEWVLDESAPVLRRTERRGERGGAQIAEELWRSKARRRRLDSRETLLSHVGLSASLGADQLTLYELNISQRRGEVSLRDARYNVRRLGRRLIKESGEWHLIQEVKVRDEQGRVSYQMQDSNGRTLSAHISDQHQLSADPLKMAPPRHLSALLRESGELNAAQRTAWRRHVQTSARRCAQPTSDDAQPDLISLRVIINAARGPVVIAGPLTPRLTPFAQCLASQLDQASTAPKGGSFSGRDRALKVELSL